MRSFNSVSFACSSSIGFPSFTTVRHKGTATAKWLPVLGIPTLRVRVHGLGAAASISFKQAVYKVPGIELGDVFSPLASAHEEDRQVELLRHGKGNATFCCAVQLGQE